MPFTLVLGGARSGKSRYAQAAAEGESDQPVMIATGQAFDDEMRDRIKRHQDERGDKWRTLEAPTELVERLAGLCSADVAVIDCLTLWLSNLMLADRDIAVEVDRLVEAAAACPARLWLVSNEVGWGIVPETPLGRAFRDEAGRLHQRLAQQADEVMLIVAGLPMVIKSPHT